MGASTAGAGDNPVVNADFEIPERVYTNAIPTGDASDERRKTDGGYWRTEFPGWSFDKIGEQFIISDVSAFDRLDGVDGTVARFSEIEEDSFNDNMLFQVVALEPDGDDSVTVRFNVTTQFPQADNFERPLDARLRVCFQSSLCGEEAERVTRRFDLVLAGADASASTGDEQLAIAPWEWAEGQLTVDVPAGADVVRVEFSVTDGTDDDSFDQPEGPRQVYFDDFRLTQGDATLALVNAAFSDYSAADGDTAEARRDDYFNRKFAGFPDDDQGPFGWTLTDLDEDDYATVPVPAAVVKPQRHYGESGQPFEPFDAHSGERVFRFMRSGNSFGDDNLDQCVFIGDSANQDFNLAAWARASEGSDEEVAELSFQFFAGQEDCLLHGDNALAHRNAFAIAEADTWQPLIASAQAPNGDEWVRISLRARDPEGRQAAQDPDAGWLRVYFDTVTPWTLPEPSVTTNGDNGTVTFSLEGGPSGGVSIAYTLDGSDPDDTSDSVSPGGFITLGADDVDADGEVEVRALAAKGGWTDSPVVARSFTVSISDDDDDDGNGDNGGDVGGTPEPTPPASSGSSGCSVARADAPVDPTLWVLAGLAGLALLRRWRGWSVRTLRG